MTIVEGFKSLLNPCRDIFIKPPKPAKYITLNIMPVNSKVTFEEVTGTFFPRETIKEAFERLS